MKILCSTAFHGAMPFILETFAKHSTAVCEVSFGTTVALTKLCTQRDDIDAVILTSSGIAELLVQQRLVASSVTNFAKTGVGIAIAKNAPTYDISTTASCLDTLKKCRSIAFTQQGASGIYFGKLIALRGIEELILAKAIRPEGGLVAQLVAHNQAELAVQLVSEIKAVPEVDLLGFLPEELQEWSTFSIAQCAPQCAPQSAPQGAAQPPHANSAEVRALTQLLQSPEIQNALPNYGFLCV